MASTKVIATTWAKKDLVNALKGTLKRMDDEINAWEKENKTLNKRQEAWDKKAQAWAKANLTKGEVKLNNSWRGLSFVIEFDTDDAEKALGKRPEQGRRPEYKDANYSNNHTSDWDQVENAIALVQGSTDTEFKINTTSAWAKFIR